jgi:AraC-like DNA-binding protein
MKPVPAIISGHAIVEPAFLIREIKQPYFDSEFHFHGECQLVYIIKGSGKRIVGDSIEYFTENELVFLGPNIPHVWYNAGGAAHPSKHSGSQSLSLFIAPGRLKDILVAFGEAHKSASLLHKGQRGMFITGQTKKELVGLLTEAASLKGIARVAVLFQILHILISTNEYSFLASATYENRLQFRDNDRMNRVYHYLLENFQDEIQLSQVAEVAGMNPNAFCRYFKSRTQKSCTSFINELRISYACKLLSENDVSITSVAFECGFNNVSNFNRAFRMIKKISPSQYRKELEIV